MPKRARTRTAFGKDVNSVTKAVDVLRAFIDGQESWGVRELANALGQPGSSTHRVLQILRREGFVEWDAESRKYETGMEFFRWWAILGGRLKVAEVARPLMSELAVEIGETCLLGLYKAGDHRHAYVAEALAHQGSSFNALIGNYAPLWSSAGGLSILALLPEPARRAVFKARAATGPRNPPRSLEGHLAAVRAAGYGVMLSSDDDAPVTVGAAVTDAHGNPVGSLTIAAPRGRYAEPALREIGARVSSYAGRLSRMIGAQMLGGAGGIGSWTLGIDVIARVIQREIPGIGSTIWNASGDQALQDLQNGRGGYCFAVAGSLWSAYRGEAPFTHPHGQLRAMCSLFPIFLHIVTRRNSGIGSFRDLKGKRVSAGEADFTTARVVAELMRRAGILERGRAAARTLVYLNYAEATREFAAGKLDVIISLTALGDPAYRKLARSFDLRLIPLDPASAGAFVARHSAYETGVIPAATYAGADEPTETLAVPTVLVTTAERSDDEVYAATRAIYRERDRIAAALGAPETLKPPYLFRGIDVPLHPGAERFWREQGLIGPPALVAPAAAARRTAPAVEPRRSSSRR